MSSGSGYGSSDLNPVFSQSFSLPTQDEGDDGWAQSQRIYGDFYREPVETVTRGVTLSGPTLVDSFSCGAGDFYREPDNVFKGLTLPGPPGPFEEQDFFKDVASPFEPIGKAKGVASPFGPFDKAEAGNAVKVERFVESELPPATPTDPFWRYEVTTFFLTTQTPSAVGNTLLDFLNGQVEASITKVRNAKYSIKAEVFVKGVMCSLKIRTYSHYSEVDTYAVEFQRRSGCCVTFNYAYQQAQHFLKTRFGGEVSPPLMLFPPALQPDSPTSSDAEISPLLDMAGLVEFPGLQAESAAALSDMAKDPNAATTLCTESAFKEFQKLLQSDNTDVAYPTARLLTSLAHCKEASAFFVSDGFLQLMIEKVRSKPGGTAQLVQRELAQALQVATAQSVERMGEYDRSMVERLLMDVIEDVANDEEILCPLQQALQTLRLYVA